MSKNMASVYLCGPINGCNGDQAIAWRNWLKLNTAFHWVDPMKRDYRGSESDHYREIVELDKRDLRSCQYVIAMYTEPSVGTSMEVFFAWTLGIPVIVIDHSGKPISPWLQYHASTIVLTKHQALDKLLEWER